jgi:hypothetical protein
MKRILFSLLALVCMTLTASADAVTYNLTKADGAEAYGTIKFYVGTDLTNPVSAASAGQTVTMTITPNTDCVVNTDKLSGLWIAVEAKAPRRAGTFDVDKDITLTAVANAEVPTYTFTMIAATAEISCAYKKLLTNADITVDDIDDQTYSGSSLTPEVTVKDNGTELVNGTDYTLSYDSNLNAGTGTVTITGIGDNYTGKTTKTFKVDQAESNVLFNPWHLTKSLDDEDFILAPNYEGDGTLTYSSDNEDVATVDSQTGLVHIVGTGVAAITASVSATMNYAADYDWYQLTVDPIQVAYENGSITQNKDGYTVVMTEDEDHPNAKPLPDDADLSKLTYKRELVAPGNEPGGDGSGDVIIDEKPANLFTVCLPFTPKKNAALKYYTLTSVSGETLHFDEVADVKSHTPYLVAIFGDVNVMENCSNLIVSSMEIKSTTVDGYTFNGTFTGKENADALGLYILQSGNRWGKVTSGSVYIPPFRAFVEGPAAGARTLDSTFGDNATGIQNIRTVDSDGTERWFDLNGRRIEKPTTKGVYIQNGKKIMIK